MSKQSRLQNNPVSKTLSDTEFLHLVVQVFSAYASRQHQTTIDIRFGTIDNQSNHLDKNVPIECKPTSVSVPVRVISFDQQPNREWHLNLELTQPLTFTCLSSDKIWKTACWSEDDFHWVHLHVGFCLTLTTQFTRGIFHCLDYVRELNESNASPDVKYFDLHWWFNQTIIIEQAQQMNISLPHRSTDRLPIKTSFSALYKTLKSVNMGTYYPLFRHLSRQSLKNLDVDDLKQILSDALVKIMKSDAVTLHQLFQQ